MLVFRAFLRRPRLLASLAAGLIVYLLGSGVPRAATQILLAWNAGTILFLILSVLMMARSTLDHLQTRADEEDAGAVLVLALTVVAAIVSLGAIGAELQGMKDAGGGWDRGLRIALVATTILSSWLFVHTIFALHYAHEYFAGDDDRKGLTFPEAKEPPDYWDFLYFSFNLGAAAQTSDVAVTAKRMRRFVLAHTILSFLFNTTVLALAINVGASML